MRQDAWMMSSPFAVGPQMIESTLLFRPEVIRIVTSHLQDQNSCHEKMHDAAMHVRDHERVIK